jgi:hypothetical protein
MDPAMRNQFEFVRRLRNAAVHDIEAPSEEELLAAARFIELFRHEVLKRLQAPKRQQPQ